MKINRFGMPVVHGLWSPYDDAPEGYTHANAIADVAAHGAEAPDYARAIVGSLWSPYDDAPTGYTHEQAIADVARLGAGAPSYARSIVGSLDGNSKHEGDKKIGPVQYTRYQIPAGARTRGTTTRSTADETRGREDGKQPQKVKRQRETRRKRGPRAEVVKKVKQGGLNGRRRKHVVHI